MRSKIFLALWLGWLCAVTGCGRVGDPVAPPSRSMENTQLVEVIQRGDRVLVRWPRPNLKNPQTSGVSRVDIYRLIDEPKTQRFLREEIFLEQAQLVGYLTGEQLAASDGAFIVFEDRLDPADQSWQNQRFRYAIRYTDTRNRQGALSNFAFVEPSATIALQPTGLTSTFNQSAISLEWKAPSQTLAGTAIGTAPRYNIYRRGPKGEFSRRALNPTPLTEARFQDTQFQFENTYVYTVRTVTEVGGVLTESDDAEVTTVSPKDTFAPAAPQNVTGAAAAGVTSLFWPSNSEADLKGYLVYRAESSDAPTWQRLTPNPISTTTFRDLSAEVGKVYLYRLTAVDVFANESPASEVVTVEVVR